MKEQPAAELMREMDGPARHDVVGQSMDRSPFPPLKMETEVRAPCRRA